jgi:hypothetical protein
MIRSKQLNERPNSSRKIAEYQCNDVRKILERPDRINYKIKSDQIDILIVVPYLQTRRQTLPTDVKQL